MMHRCCDLDMEFQVFRSLMFICALPVTTIITGWLSNSLEAKYNVGGRGGDSKCLNFSTQLLYLAAFKHEIIFAHSIGIGTWYLCIITMKFYSALLLS